MDVMKGVESTASASTSSAPAVAGIIGSDADRGPEKRTKKSRKGQELPEARVDTLQGKDISGDDEEDAAWLRRRQANDNGNVDSIQDDRQSVSS